MKRRFNDKSRGTGNRKRKPVMFLSLEGNNKSEKRYLISLNKDQGDMYSLQFTSGRETDPINMWRSLQALMKDAFSLEDGDKAFCVCDRDFEEYKHARIQKIKLEAHCDDAKLIVSNPCFEIWYLNHFRYTTRSFNGIRELMDELCSFLTGYEKNGDYFHSYLKAKTTDAISNSIRQIVQVNEGNPLDEIVIGNPGTEVFEIVQLFHA